MEDRRRAILFLSSLSIFSVSRNVSEQFLRGPLDLSSVQPMIGDIGAMIDGI